jgi:hypothetical protein
MSKLIFILSGYEPDYSAVGICIKNLIEIIEKDYEVIIISEKTIVSQIDQTISNSKLIFVESRIQYIKNNLIFKIANSDSLRKSVFKAFLFLVKVYGLIKVHISRININKNLIEKYDEKILEIAENNDILIPVCLPFESICSAVNIKSKKKSIKVYPLLFDKFSENKNLHRSMMNYVLKIKKHIRVEQKMLDSCDGIFYTDSWSNHFKKFHEGRYRDKIYLIEHPLLKELQKDVSFVKKSKDISVTYAGTLYKKIRSPKFALKLFSKLNKAQNKINLLIFSKGNCNSYIKRKAEVCKFIIFHGEVQKNIADNAVSNSHVLLSIGNTDISQFPSKIFEYISTGKPIIHTFKSPEDPVIKILAKYKNSLVINESNGIDINLIDEIIRFLKKIKEVPYDLVENLYIEATPKYVVNQILSVIWGE